MVRTPPPTLRRRRRRRPSSRGQSRSSRKYLPELVRDTRKNFIFYFGNLMRLVKSELI
jgi:hypothetical protein